MKRTFNQLKPSHSWIAIPVGFVGQNSELFPFGGDSPKVEEGFAVGIIRDFFCRGNFKYH